MRKQQQHMTLLNWSVQNWHNVAIVKADDGFAVVNYEAGFSRLKLLSPFYATPDEAVTAKNHIIGQ